MAESAADVVSERLAKSVRIGRRNSNTIIECRRERFFIGIFSLIVAWERRSPFSSQKNHEPAPFSSLERKGQAAITNLASAQAIDPNIVSHDLKRATGVGLEIQEWFIFWGASECSDDFVVLMLAKLGSGIQCQLADNSNSPSTSFDPPATTRKG